MKLVCINNKGNGYKLRVGETYFAIPSKNKMFEVMVDGDVRLYHKSRFRIKKER